MNADETSPSATEKAGLTEPKLLPDTRIKVPTEPLVGEMEAEGKGVGIGVLVGVGVCSESGPPWFDAGERPC